MREGLKNGALFGENFYLLCERMKMKRTKWIWVITIFAILAVLGQLNTIYIQDELPIEGVGNSYVQSLTFFDLYLGLFLSILFLIGAIALLFLRGISLYFFIGHFL